MTDDPMTSALDRFETVRMETFAQVGDDPDASVTFDQFGRLTTAISAVLQAQNETLLEVLESQRFLRDAWRTLGQELGGVTEDGHLPPQD